MHLATPKESVVDQTDAPRHFPFKVQPDDSVVPCRSPHPAPPGSLLPGTAGQRCSRGCQIGVYIRKASPHKLMSPTWSGY